MQTEDIILNRKLQVLFTDKKHRDKAKNLLRSYGHGRYEKETDRVRLAILKLSGADLDKLEHNTKCAKQDYRDVLAWAEYPRQSKHWSLEKSPEKEARRKADRDEYEAWLIE